MSRVQSCPFQELVLLNIIIHGMIINQTETSCFTPAVEEKPEAMIVPFTVLTINKSRGILEINVPVTSAFHQNGWKSVNPKRFWLEPLRLILIENTASISLIPAAIYL